MISDNDLFKPNNHSANHIIWDYINKSSESSIRNLLKEHYRLDTITQVQKINEWERMSHNYRVGATVNGKRKQYHLQKHILHNSKESILLMDKIVFNLHSQNIPVPKVVQSQKGNQYIFFQGHYWQLFDFIDGEHFQGSQKELIDVAENIARLHLAMCKIQGTVPTKWKYTWKLQDFIILLKFALKSKNRLSLILKSYKSYLSEQCDLTSSRIKKIDDFRIQPIHHDLHPHNVLYKNGRLVSFLDFGDVSLGHLARDVGNACHRFVRQYVVNQKKGWRKTLPQGIDIFLNHYSKINHLTEKDILLMPKFVKDELLGKMYYILHQYYYNHDSQFVAKGGFDKLLILLMEADILQKYMN